MRIIIGVHHFPPRYTGGAEWRTYRTAAKLQARGHTVQVICVENVDKGSSIGVSWEDEIFQGVAIRRLSYNLAYVPDPFRWEYDNVWIGEHLREFCSEWKPDLFHLISGYLLSGRTLKVMSELGIPSVVTLTDFWFLCRRINLLKRDGKISELPISSLECARCFGEDRRRYRWLGRLLPSAMRWYWKRRSREIKAFDERTNFLLDSLNRAAAIICPSEFLRSVFIQAGIKPEHLYFSRQGRDFPELTTANLEKLPSEKLRVGYIGQIAPHKGVHILLEAMRQLSEQPIELKIYGDTLKFSKYSDRLHRMTSGDERVHWSGIFHHGEVSQVLRDLDILVIPSLWYENSPNSILEAQAHKTPVIASNHGGMAELVQHEKNGLVFEAGNSVDLAYQLQRLIDSPEFLSKLRSGIGTLKSEREEIDELLTVYEAIMSGK